jgi:DNA-binding NtrC family response regulator
MERSQGGEAELILRVLKQEHWNKTKVAERLSWSRATLYRKLDKYGLR